MFLSFNLYLNMMCWIMGFQFAARSHICEFCMYYKNHTII